MRLLACLLLLLALPAHAQMYKCTDGGKTRFSDKPFTDCKTQNQAVKVQPNVAVSTPARSYAPRPPHPDPKCASLQRQMREVQRAGVKDEASEQRWQELRTALKPCN